MYIYICLYNRRWARSSVVDACMAEGGQGLLMKMCDACMIGVEQDLLYWMYI